MSLRAKVVYALIFDRRSLSLENNWYDKNGDVYMYFTNQQMMEKLNCSEKTIISSKKELEKYGLIREVRQGVNRPNRLYINGTVKITGQELEKLQSGTVKITGQELEKLQPIKTNNIKTNNNHTNIINTDDDAGQKSFSKIIKDSNIKINERHTQMLLDYIGLDNMTVDMIQYAIEKTEDAGSTSFNYLKAILENWKKEGFTSLEEVKEHEQKRQETQSYQNKQKDFKSGRYALLGTDISVHEIDPELGF
nr:MAG TPA: replisome organizer protein [Caudoviricetes sp.]